MMKRSTLNRTSTSKAQRTSGRRGRKVGKGCDDTLSSGYDTAFRKSLQLSFAVQDWAQDHFVMCKGGTHEAPPLTEEFA